MIVEQILAFLLGVIYAGGGSYLAFQGLYDQKNMIESVMLAVLGAITGIFLCVWSLTCGFSLN